MDDKEQKINLYPMDQRKEDYVQSELRRLRESLRSESAKMHRPQQFSFFFLLFAYLIIFFFFIYSKAHEPFVYNDLSPYFDTSTVEKAIHEVMKYLFEKRKRFDFFLSF